MLKTGILTGRSSRAARSGWLRDVSAAAAVLVLLPGIASAAGQEQAGPPLASPLPPWAVLVLQPVGDKRVRPVTGVVVSAEGAVLVPADFAAEGDVLIVLDGGTDIIEHGRPATVRARDAAAGIMLLDVPGLRRRPARLADASPSADETVVMLAFPPAEQIAEGAAPLRIETRAREAMAKVASDEASAQRLPNISGPLVNACGLLVGYSLAAGVPSLASDMGTVIAWSDSLAAALRAWGTPVPAERCTAAGAEEADSGAAEEVAETPAAKAAEADAAREPPTPDTGRADPAGTTSTSMGRVRAPLWVFTAAIALLAAGFAAWRFGRARREAQPGLLQERAIGGGLRRSAAPAAESGPVAGWQLEIAGQMPSGATFTRHCAINPAAIDAVIGSGVVDIRIDSPGVAGEHVRLGGSAGAMTLCGLAAAAGTWINRVPCSRGEIMFIADGDTLVLGETPFRVRLLAPGAKRDAAD